MLQEQTRSWPVRDIYVGCSGNFTIERTLDGHGFTLHGNDVSIYTCCLGWFLAGQAVPLTLKDESREHLDWLEPYLADPADAVASMFLATRFFASVGKTDHVYHRRVVEGTRRQWPRLHAETVAKLRALTLRLGSYSAMDVREYLHDVVPPDAGVASFPPFFAGGYEVMWKPLEDHFDWPAPTYPVLDDSAIADVLHQITNRAHWFFGSNHRHEDLEDRLCGMVHTGERRVPMYVYASGGSTRVVVPQQKLRPVTNPRLGPGDTIGERLALAPLKPEHFRTLRSQYLNKQIKPADPMWSYGVMVDGVLVGAFGYNRDKFGGTAVYLMSDFAVAPSDYPRLSKLVVLAATSREAQLLLQSAQSKRITAVTTTAFAQKPVSMKYRGLLTQTKREKSKDPAYAWQLQYEGAMGQHTLAEAMATWRARWGEKRNGDTVREATSSGRGA